MSIALVEFVQQLEDSGVLAGDTLMDFLPPRAFPSDTEELAHELIRKKLLTRYQFEAICEGKGKSLIVGNYILMEKAGEGGMGVVFKARHRRIDRIVAVKVLSKPLADDPTAVARFEREARAMARLNHPNVVVAHDADCANGIHFLVMEFVCGSDLSSLVRGNGPLSIAKAINYVVQAARGLGAIHNNGITHRDVKPANLLLDSEGIVKVLDMGIARFCGDDQLRLNCFESIAGSFMGTPEFMAPEQAIDVKSADARADIYALGCSLYYLLTGRSPYEGRSPRDTLLAHQDHPIPSLCSIRSDVSVEIENVFRTMVAKNVHDRYRTMSEVIAALDGCDFSQVDKLDTLQPMPPFSTDTGLSTCPNPIAD